MMNQYFWYLSVISNWTNPEPKCHGEEHEKIVFLLKMALMNFGYNKQNECCPGICYPEFQCNF